MNNAELDKRLRHAAVPERAPEYWDDFPKAVTRRLCSKRNSSPSSLRRRSIFRLSWLAGFATACLAIGFGIGFWRGHDSVTEQAQLAAMQKCFAEISLLFPHQVRAIVVDDQGLRLLLADQPNLPDAQPLYVKICGPRGCQRVVTFSGQQIRVNGELFDVLLDSQANVLIAGEHWVWSSANTVTRTPQYHIQAHLLEDI